MRTEFCGPPLGLLMCDAGFEAVKPACCSTSGSLGLWARGWWVGFGMLSHGASEVMLLNWAFTCALGSILGGWELRREGGNGGGLGWVGLVCDVYMYGV